MLHISHSATYALLTSTRLLTQLNLAWPRVVSKPLRIGGYWNYISGHVNVWFRQWWTQKSNGGVMGISEWNQYQ